MVFSWFKDRRRKELLAESFPAAWQEYLVNNARHYVYIEPPKQAMVQAVVRVVVAEKNWSGGAGFEITDEMKVTVAAQASLLVLGFDEPYFSIECIRSSSILAPTCARGDCSDI